MWKYIGFVFALLFASLTYGQNKSIADNYFNRGDYEKALEIYSQLYEKSPNNYNLFIDLVKTHQELEAYDKAHQLLEEKRRAIRNPRILVELAQNARLQEKESRANEYYQMALDEVRERPMYASTIGRALEGYNLLDWAEEVYKLALKNENANTSLQLRLAYVYGEQGKVQEMFLTFIDLIEKEPRYNNIAQHHFSNYILEDKDNEANQIFKRVLLQKIQKEPKLTYYELLSWVFIQEKNYRNAFTQEKAIRRRDKEEGLGRVKSLAILAYQNEAFELTKDIANYILEEADPRDMQTIFDGEHLLLQLDVATAKEKDYPKVVSHFKDLIAKYKEQANVAILEMDYAKFIAYKLNEKKKAIQQLREILKRDLPRYNEASIRLLLGDILVTDNQFNPALIQYTHVQRSMEGQELGHEANFKIAQTSYFKGDFRWALTQLNVLKRATTQLIANDAMFLNLRIQDNILGDSTHTSLKDFAAADLLVLQDKPQQAIELLNDILVNHQGKSIIDDAHFKLGELYFDLGNYEQAAEHWEVVVQEHTYDLLADAAFYRLGLLYEEKFNQPEKAMTYYERIIFDYSDSIYFVDARKRFRKLRGDFNPKT
ncbi:MAG TPA: tetratricopeptide repeat protein [Flavobacteriaceae bacterium]|nr:tetratricopeptide repeat protein [Flavobacteriaceae bacterium]